MDVTDCQPEELMEPLNLASGLANDVADDHLPLDLSVNKSEITAIQFPYHVHSFAWMVLVRGILMFGISNIRCWRMFPQLRCLPT